MVATSRRVSRGRLDFSRLAKYATWVAIAFGLGLTWYLYWATLSTGFMFDDPLDLPRAMRPLTQIFTDAGESSYYRPIVLVIWKAAYTVLHRHDPLILHALDLAAGGDALERRQVGERHLGDAVDETLRPVLDHVDLIAPKLRKHHDQRRMPVEPPGLELRAGEVCATLQRRNQLERR